MSLNRAWSLVLLPVLVGASEAAGANVTVSNATSNQIASGWTNWVFCSCGVTCAQNSSWPMLSMFMGQSCECTPCRGSPGKRLRGSASHQGHHGETPVDPPADTSFASFVGPHDLWDATGPHDATSTALYCRCGRKCDLGGYVPAMATGIGGGLSYAYRCYRFSCLPCR